MITSYIIAIVFLLFVSAFFSAAEIAYSSSTKTTLKAYGKEKRRNVRNALRLLNNFDMLLSAILIGNNLANTLIASLSTLLYMELFNGSEMPIISALIATFVILIIGEVTPKSIVKDYAEPFAVFSAPLLRLTIIVFLPVSLLFTYWKKLLSKVFKLKHEQHFSSETMLMYVEDGCQEGDINENEAELLKNALNFPEKDAGDIATPRIKIFALPIDSSKEEIARAFSETKFSRLLVYEKSVDHIVGAVLMKNFYTGMNVTDREIRDIISPVIFLSASEKIGRILKKMQKEQCQIAVVLDEFGGTYGILTIEDVLEELVGEIWDEHEQKYLPIRQISENTYQVDAVAELDFFCDFFHVSIESEMNTLNGWLSEMSNGLPGINDTFQYENLTIKVIAVNNRMVSTLEVKVAPKKESESESDSIQ